MQTTAPAVPVLPVDEIRRAIAAHDWARATGLMAAHQQELAAAMRQIDWSSVNRGPWMDLLLAQRDLMAELEQERARVSEALNRLNDDHRGARAWLRELA
jgi:hypothetical protein